MRVVGYRHDATSLLDAAVDEALANGLSQLTFGRLARRLGINDRTIVYYFPTKRDLIRAVAGTLGLRLMAILDTAFGDQALTEQEVLQRAWPHLATPAADPVFAIFFELVGLAAAGIEPFAELAGELVRGWVQWLEPRLDVPAGQSTHDAAIAVIAGLDGLLLVRQILGPRAAARAARHAGVAGRGVVSGSAGGGR